MLFRSCLREQFPITKRTAFFDIAYENCGAAFVRERMEDYFVHKADVYPGLVKAGGAGKGETIAVVAEARERLARFLNAPGVRSVAFTENTTQGINLILQGFPFQPGDNIVVGELEHVAVYFPKPAPPRFRHNWDTCVPSREEACSHGISP